ncbi:MAG: hypothetical protein HY880_02100 [Deltaproteobacteria bacterium]|nr:hypothetical protein [Deltaproteobacteria bacterium]
MVYSISGKTDMRFDKCLESFLVFKDTADVPTCRLSIVKHKTKLDVQHGNQRVFEADTTWGLYKSQGPGVGGQGSVEGEGRELGYVLTVPSLKNRRHPQLVAELDKDFMRGDVHIGRNGAHHFLYPFLELVTINLLGKGNGVLLHACCVDDNGKGYLFVGQSGAGKSTMADLWNGRDGVRVLSDDRVIVHTKQGARENEKDAEFVAYGTPWHGTGNYAVNAGVPVEKIYLISHAEKNSAVPVKGMQPVTRLIRDSFLPFWDRDGINYSVGFIERIVKGVDVFDLEFVPDGEAVNFIRNM